MPRSILDETQNVLKVYMHCTGKSEVPKTFHLWCCVSLIAALLRERVWFEKFPGKRMYPNLYTILIGPSAGGKGQAIDFAMSFIEGLEEELGEYRGKVTGAAMADEIDARYRKQGHDGPPIMFLLTPELSMSVGEGGIAKDFIKRMTEMFTGGNYIYREGTRTHGKISFKVPVLNWLAGSTKEWLMDSVPVTSIRSGAFGRMITAESAYDPDFRVCNPTVPADFKEAIEWLMEQFKDILTWEGRFVLTEEAEQVRERWYMTRPAPEDPALLPSWKREDDLVLKVAMCLAVAAGRTDMQITATQMSRAQTLVTDAHKYLSELICFASQSVETTGLTTVEEMIKTAGEITQSALLRKVTHRGIHAKQLNEHTRALEQRGDIRVGKTKTGARLYVWIAGRSKVFS